MAKRRRGFDRGPTTGSRRSAAPMNRAQREAAEAAARKRRSQSVIATIGLGLAIVVFAVVGGALGSDDPSPSPSAGTSPGPSTTQGAVSTLAPTPTIGGSGPVISGVACDVDEQVAYHVHAHLNIRVDGELQPIPADVGITSTCLYWLHTHSNQGVIHVEAPAETTFTLGQFFDVWGETLSATQVGDRMLGAGESLYVFVDREPVAGDPRAIELRDLRAIELQIGTAPLEPLPYTFPPDLQ